MLRRMTLEHLMEWQAYERMEPFTREVTKYHLAAIAQMLFNMNIDTKKTKARPLMDFVLTEEKDEETPAVTPEQNRKHVELILDNWIFGQNALVAAGKRPAE